MPELPDVEVYREAIAARVTDEPLVAVHIDHPFVLRTAVPPIGDAEGRRVREVRRLGKRIVLALDDALFLVIHLMSVHDGTAVRIANPFFAYVASEGTLTPFNFSTAKISPSSSFGIPQQASFSTTT